MKINNALKKDTLDFLELMKIEERSDLDCCIIQFGDCIDSETGDDLSWKKERIKQIEYAIACIQEVRKR